VGKASRKKKGSLNEISGGHLEIKETVTSSLKSPFGDRLPKTNSIIALTPYVLIMLVSFAVYLNAFNGNFVYDDTDQILMNPWIKDIKNLPTIFLENVWSFKQEVGTSNYYRPLMHIVYMINYYVFGLKPWGYHLVNVLFHCGAAVLVFLMTRRFLPPCKGLLSLVYLSPPFMCALLFAAHPIHTEAVAWIAGLPDVAFTFFYLLSFYLYILFRDGARRVYLLSVLSFSAATFFKETALTLPIMLGIYDCLFHKRDKTIMAGIKTYMPYVVVIGGYLSMRYYALRSFVPIDNYPELSAYQLTINVFPLFAKYLASLLWPFDLNVWHTFHPIRSLVEAKGVISLAVTVVFLIAAAVAYKKNKTVLFGILFFFVSLLPAFYIRGIAGKPFAERYLYLPSVGFVLLLAIFLSWNGVKMPRAAMGITLVCMMVLGIYCAGTITRNNDWKDELSLWSDTVRNSPDSAEVHDNLGLAYSAKGLMEMAISEFQMALRLKPRDANAHYNLALLYQGLGYTDMARAEFEAVLRIRPNDYWTRKMLLYIATD